MLPADVFHCEDVPCAVDNNPVRVVWTDSNDNSPVAVQRHVRRNRLPLIRTATQYIVKCMKQNITHIIQLDIRIILNPFLPQLLYLKPGMRCLTTSETNRSVPTISGRRLRKDICFGMHLDILSALEALRNALHKFKTYLLTHE